MFDKADYIRMYDRFLGPLSQPVSLLLLRNGFYTSYETIAHVSQYQESDLIPGGSIQLGDLRIIIKADDLRVYGITSMGLKDRVNVNDRTYAVVQWDAFTRTVGVDSIAVEVAVRGGGIAAVASISVYRITSQGDQRITGNGDRRIIKEAM